MKWDEDVPISLEFLIKAEIMVGDNANQIVKMAEDDANQILKTVINNQRLPLFNKEFYNQYEGELYFLSLIWFLSPKLDFVIDKKYKDYVHNKKGGYAYFTLKFEDDKLYGVSFEGVSEEEVNNLEKKVNELKKEVNELEKEVINMIREFNKNSSKRVGMNYLKYFMVF